ncbi:MAG: preprotein translocase subunit SecE [Rubrivirga sp.]|jgi:preprotein translocase subunit SecE|nr:preprotein translocase subunit SecE [Micrococcales bacterium]MBR24248.1 preprotein translocase subunit SecE [Rubrivirga sp.]OUV54304.1 MAG: preprotein translocase subunit SecE [Actinomycetales bacterium TMED115]PQM59065.1 MAG: preprotein translocase subunit SecE [Actinomycetales bacterium]RZP27668.1 MAG: preprotein translocase subunit SecE [Acidimicrobiales bacterium]HCL70968.1 preprotein translocase subunit SecE [Actinomycetota bacterium]|tara:strand:- start:6188 stop:6433 length:246 start_codon:yes stop_codon:yes gene_type:complete
MAEVEERQQPSSGSAGSERGFFSRLALFIRQVIAELRKVIWPTRKELIAYTTVVLFFVLVMAGIIAAYDYVFTQGVLFVFG